MELTEKEIEILQLLKKEKELPTAKVSIRIGRNQYATEDLLYGLEIKKKVERVKKSKGTYWKLKKGGKVK